MNLRHIQEGIGLAATAVIYFLLAKGGLEFASVNPSATPIWPATGFAIAAVLLFGYRVAPAIFAGAFLANVTTAGSVATSLAIGLGNTAECLLVGYLVNRWAGGTATFETPARVALFALFSLFPTAISATVGATSLAATGFADGSEILQLWLTWWMGDLAGALLICPLLVLWWTHPRDNLSASDLPETIAIYATACAVGFVAFTPQLQQIPLREPLGFLAILPLLWAALRRTQRDTIGVAVILSAFAVWGTLSAGGPFARPAINDSFLLLLAFMTSASVPSLALSAAVSVRKAVERELRLAHDLQSAHLRVAQQLVKLGSWMWDVRRNTVTWSPGLYEIYGLKEGEFGGTFEFYLEQVHPDDREHVRSVVMRAFQARTPFQIEERIVRSGGDIRHLSTSGEVIRDDNGDVLYMIGACHDVTEQKQARTALQSTEQQYRLMVDSVHDYALYMLDTTGKVTSWNPGAARIKQYSVDEIIGQHFSRFYTPEDRNDELPARALRLSQTAGKYEAEGWRVRKDGSRFWANVVIDPVHDDSGKLIGFAKITRDITERRQTQLALEQAREQLAQSQKLEAIGQLSGGIAHDFNNLLMIISGYIQLLQRGLTDPKQIKAIDAIRTAVERGTSLTRQLLTFSRRQTLNPVVTDLTSRIEPVREMLARTLPGNIALEVNIPSDTWHTQIDIGEFELALINVAVNARDAMPKGGTIAIDVRNRNLRPGDAAGLTGDFVAISVRDTGAGIPPDVLAKVFDPFFTTKPTGKGTGLGLSQVYGFAHQSGGAATIESGPDRGTTVTIFLPRSHAERTLPADARPPEDVKALSGVALLIEDNADVAAVTASLLEQSGCRVVHTDNAADALERLQAGGFDMVLSDIVMPGAMNGLQLAHRIRETYPDLPILLISGYSDAILSAAAAFPLLKKPFNAADLHRAVQQAMTDKTASAGRAAAAAPAAGVTG